MNRILRVIELKKEFPGVLAVNRISFEMMGSEIFGFLGPNGAGKTTTIHMLTGLAKISSGTIFFRGEEVSQNMIYLQQNIGVVPDESNLYQDLSGFENLCFCGALYGMGRNERNKKAKELLDFFDLRDAAGRKFSTYSKGMKRKLTIAAALIHDPAVLFLDEPTTGLDVASVRQIRTLIRDLNSRGVTIFLTTHYIEEAERLCHRVAFIHRGRIIKTGTVEELVDASKESSVIEISFERIHSGKSRLYDKLVREFPGIDCIFVNDSTLKVTSENPLEISPVVGFLAAEGLVLYEVKRIRPSLEDAFVKATGIEAVEMKREKEKK